jgi:hypothetical protein
MCLIRKLRSFVVDYEKDRAVSNIDSVKNRNALALVVLKLLKKIPWGT